MKKKENFEQLQLLQSSIFFAETLHTFPTYQCLQMGVSDFFYLFRSCVTCKNKKRPGFYTLVFDIFLKNSRSNKVKKFRTTLQESCAKFQQKMLNFVAVRLVKVFNFSDKQLSFSKIIELCLSLGIRFCINRLVLPNKKITP